MSQLLLIQWLSCRNAWFTIFLLFKIAVPYLRKLFTCAQYNQMRWTVCSLLAYTYIFALLTLWVSKILYSDWSSTQLTKSKQTVFESNSICSELRSSPDATVRKGTWITIQLTHCESLLLSSSPSLPTSLPPTLSTSHHLTDTVTHWSKASVTPGDPTTCLINGGWEDVCWHALSPGKRLPWPPFLIAL